MNKQQAELFMQDLNELKQKIHTLHMSVIKRYKAGVLSYDNYKILDTKYTTELDTIHTIQTLFLEHKNTNV